MQFVGPHKTCWERGRVFRFVLASEQNYRVIMQSLFAVRRWEQQYDRPHASIGSSARAVPQRSRRYKNVVAFCIPLLIKPVACVAPLQVTGMLRMCYPLVHGWPAGGDCVLAPRYFVLPPRPPPNEYLGGPLRGDDNVSVLPPHPPRTVVVSML